MAKVLPITGGIDASVLRAGLAQAIGMETGIFPFRKRMQLGDATLWFKKAPSGQVTVFVGGGTKQLTMDAGVIDLVTTAIVSPQRFARGLRLDTASTLAANAFFTTAPVTGPWQAYLADTADVPNGQMVGTVTFEPFTGHLRPGTDAPSFTPKRAAVVPATDPPTWKDDPTDDLLAQKKVMAFKCPASMFTGRTRFYVQALYGRPLYQPQGATVVADSVPIYGSPSLGAGAIPSILVPAFKRTDDTVVYPPYEINVSTGVRFDPVTGNHWLISVSSTQLNVTPLKSTVAGEAARKFLAGKLLKGTTPPAGVLASDLERLEAYVLAYSLPDVKNTFSVLIGADTGPNYSMGYGWHWNYSGSKANIVTATTYDQGIVAAVQQYGMVTTHRAITVAVAADGTWSAAVAVIEGPVQWGVNRVLWCIAEPEWGSMAPVKSTPKFSQIVDGADAPFYAFYTRDTLQLCRVKTTVVPATVRTRTQSFAFASGGYGNAVSYQTEGALDGFCDDAEAVNKHWSAVFTCGGTVSPTLFMGRNEGHNRWDVSNKILTDPGTRNAVNDVSSPGGTNITTGYDFAYQPPGKQTTFYPGPIYYNISTPVFQVTNTYRAQVMTDTSLATLVVPFYDAEAIFIEAATFNNVSKTGQLSEIRSQNALGTTTRVSPAAPAYPAFGGPLTEWLAAGLGALISATNPANSSVDTNTELQQLVCIAGAPSVAMGQLGSFHDANDYGQVNFTVLSGQSATNPVVLCGSLPAPLGFTGTAPNFSALVGWI